MLIAEIKSFKGYAKSLFLSLKTQKYSVSKIMDIAMEHFSFQLWQLQSFMSRQALHIFESGFHQHVRNLTGDNEVKFLIDRISTFEMAFKKLRGH